MDGVIVVVGMEEEMEEKKMEELVVKMEGKVVENGWPKEGARALGCWFRWQEMEKEEEKK